MKRIAPFALAASLALPGVASAQDAPIQPSTKWTVDFADNMCSLTRSYTDGAKTIHLGMIPIPTRDFVEIILLMPDNNMPRQSGRASVTLQPSGQKIDASVNEYSVAGGRLARITVDRSDLADLAAAKSMQVKWTSRRPAVHLALSSVKPAMKTLDGCVEDLLASWDYGAAVRARIVTPAVSDGPSRSWFRSSDYPSGALIDGTSGISRVRFTIGVGGRATDCALVQTSGSKELDDLSCKLILQRARYTPAKGADGKPVTSMMVFTLAWWAFDE